MSSCLGDTSPARLASCRVDFLWDSHPIMVCQQLPVDVISVLSSIWDTEAYSNWVYGGEFHCIWMYGCMDVYIYLYNIIYIYVCVMVFIIRGYTKLGPPLLKLVCTRCVSWNSGASCKWLSPWKVDVIICHAVMHLSTFKRQLSKPWL